MATIRKLRPQDDLLDLLALSRAFLNEYAAHHTVFFQIDELQDGDIVSYFSRSLETDEGATFVAVVNDRMVGYITVFVRPQARFYRVKQVGAISGLMVHRDHRRAGIARQLLDAARVFFQERGVQYFTVYTAVANRAAVRFYEKHGLAPLHVTLIGETGSRRDKNGG